jgi:hypothetical protein
VQTSVHRTKESVEVEVQKRRLKMKIIDLGDAIEMTKQSAPAALFPDWYYGYSYYPY